MGILPKDRLIFALDVPGTEAARSYVELLKDHVGVFKVGLELFTACGPEVVRAVRGSAGARVFLDLKFHDIPETVRGAMRSAASLGADFVTVHASGGAFMLRAAVEAAGSARVLAVTVLTSMDAAALTETGIDSNFTPEALVLHRARLAREAGCAGVVCSGQEAGALRREFGPDFLIVTPGVRPAAEAAGDQARVVTPFEAVSNGADYIVVGRPIRKAPDPAGAAGRIAEEIARALEGRAKGR